MNFKMIGNTSYDGKKYGITDNKALINPASLGLYNFYGGRVKTLGVTKVKGLYLCIEGTEVIDLILFDEEPEKVEVANEPVYKDDVPLSAKTVNPPDKAPNLPRRR